MGLYVGNSKISNASILRNGTYQSKTVDPSTSNQLVKADKQYDGLSSVTVNAVTSSIDNNIQAENIKDGVSILGVTGTFSGGGGAFCLPYSSYNTGGYTSTVTVYCRITEPGQEYTIAYLDGDYSMVVEHVDSGDSFDILSGSMFIVLTNQTGYIINLSGVCNTSGGDIRCCSTYIDLTMKSPFDTVRFFNNCAIFILETSNIETNHYYDAYINVSRGAMN